MGKGIEYAFILPNGETRYEIIFERKEIFIFQKMHGAIRAVPVDNPMEAS